MRPFDYVRTTTLDETCQLLGQDGDSSVRALAGGTDLLTLMKKEISVPTQLIDLKRLPDLPSGITSTAQGMTIGTLTTMTEIETNVQLQEKYPLLAEAAAVAATPQLRNMATIGGNLLQRPRCWYYRNQLVNCWLKGGDECQAQDGENQLHALFGGGPCYAVHPSDLAPALLALEATVQLRGPGGERMVPLAEFYALPEEKRRQETQLEKDELLLNIHLPGLPAGTRSTYLKAMDRKVWAFALVGVAAIVRLEEQKIVDARLVLSGVAPIPWRVTAAEQALVGATANEATFAEIAEFALADAQSLSHNAYKITLAKSLVRRALTMLTDEG
ncbi:MAG: xanthine dehydrogenase family protein subunit M [Chloroflexi bacterium]|nr:xanthine dehydrogenase family protein subunit M [Chloroflexota bacterium]